MKTHKERTGSFAIEKWLSVLQRHRKQAFIITGAILCIVAALQYFTNLSFYSCFVDDEFQSAEAARQVALTGTTEYDRAYPVTWVLAQWIRLVGYSEVSCRALSAIVGIASVASLVYITGRLCDSIGYTAIVGLLFIAEPFLTYYFRFTRMYAFAVLATIWLYYLIYRGLTYRAWYLLIAFPLAYLAYQIHINCLILMLGVVCFILVKAICTRKRAYLIFSVIVLAFAIFSLINYVFYRVNGEFFFNYKDFYGTLAGNITFEKLPDLSYLSYILQVTNLPVLSVILIGIVIGLCIYGKKMEDPLLYVFLITFGTTVFFCFFSDRYFSEQYILMVAPFAILTYAFAYIKMKECWEKVSYVLFAFLVIVSVFFIGRSVITFAKGVNPKNMDFRTAYAKIGDYYDLDTEEVPVMNSLVRTEYTDHLIAYMKPCSFDREEDMEIWLNFGQNYPDGIVTVEWLKMPQLTQNVQDVILNWSNRISGEGMDESGVNVSYYYYVKPQEITETHQDELVKAYSSDDSIYVDVDYSDWNALWECKQNPEMLFVVLDLETNNDGLTEKIGLYIPDQFEMEIGDDVISRYRIPIEKIRGEKIEEVKGVSIQPEMAVYGDSTLTLINVDDLNE